MQQSAAHYYSEYYPYDYTIYYSPPSQMANHQYNNMYYAPADLYYMYNYPPAPQPYHYNSYYYGPIIDGETPPTIQVDADIALSSKDACCSSVATDSTASTSQISLSSTASLGTIPEEDEEEEYYQDLDFSTDGVRKAADQRTTLMVRNIPNKYTQQMLLDEFAKSGFGPEKMDVLYLPVDFKKRGRNFGYAFVNFVEYKDIVSFVDKYSGKKWDDSFKGSAKVCDIAYAKVQGKETMLERFEKSAVLMAMGEEYRPKVLIRKVCKRDLS